MDESTKKMIEIGENNWDKVSRCKQIRLTFFKTIAQRKKCSSFPPTRDFEEGWISTWKLLSAEILLLFGKFAPAKSVYFTESKPESKV